MRARRLGASSLCVIALAAGISAQRPASGGIGSIQEDALKEWLTYLSSDELLGRATYTEGLGLAAQYIADHLKEWGVKPVGDNGTYFQTVKVLGVRTTSRSSVTVEVNGESRTFKDAEGVLFPRNMGGRQTVSGTVVFAGYGLQFPAAKINDYAELNPKGKVVVYIGAQGPASVPQGSSRLLFGRNRLALEKGALGVVSQQGTLRGGRAGGPPAAAPAGRGAQPDNGDFTTVQRYTEPAPPTVVAQDEFFEFLFSASKIKYAELKDRAAKREPIEPFVIPNATITFTVDPEYTVVRMRLTRNVVGVVEGTDPTLKDTYVLYGAHYDHTGYREGVAPQGRGGQAPAGGQEDRINNGADDDGSGTVALMGIARAFALGPRPKRSLLIVWHAGEENGLLGSRYNADYPVVPLEKMVAQLNMDMVGRNRDNKPEESNTVYVVGSDRISTELHNINEDANASLPKPLTMDYEMNDPADTQSIYTRSDHYSYAVKGIPIVFYFTGLHPDYHRPSDTVDKIVFDKIARIAQLAYETGRRVANLDRMVVRDNKGPRVGKGSKGRIK